MTEKKEYDRLCWQCGVEEYPAIVPSKLIGVTVSLGKCPKCGKGRGLIPLRDWLESKGEKGVMWD